MSAPYLYPTEVAANSVQPISLGAYARALGVGVSNSTYKMGPSGVTADVAQVTPSFISGIDPTPAVVKAGMDLLPESATSWSSGITDAIDDFGASTGIFSKAGLDPSFVPDIGAFNAADAAVAVEGALPFSLTDALGPIGAALPGIIAGNPGQAATGAGAFLLGNMLLPGWGGVIGSMLGNALGGSIFGQKPSIGPNGRADLGFQDGKFTFTDASADNGGDPSSSISEVRRGADFLNRLLENEAFGFSQTHFDGKNGEYNLGVRFGKENASNEAGWRHNAESMVHAALRGIDNADGAGTRQNAILASSDPRVNAFIAGLENPAPLDVLEANLNALLAERPQERTTISERQRTTLSNLPPPGGFAAVLYGA